MSNQHVQRMPVAFAAGHAPLAGLRTVALSRLFRTAHSLRAYLDDRAAGRTDRQWLDHAQRFEASHPKLARELRSYVRGGSSY